ncbi:MAG: UvrD-helicase domain-containing protein, partial [Chloroflexota bacterium]
LDQKASEMLVRWLTLLQRVQNTFHQEKARAGYLDFNDLEARTAELLANKATVRKRYQSAEFKRLLVDEFQDTNQEQWDIVRNLASLDDDVAMFLVGDPKQSIYAFRGADVSVFDAVRHTVRTHNNGLELDLTRSFRSHPGLITAFNRLFEHILTRDDNSPVAPYEIQFDQSMEAHRQTLPDPDAQTYAPIELLIQRNQSVRSGGIPSDERRLWEAHEIGLRFNQLIADKAQIHDKESNTLRDFTYGDAAILFQSTMQITVYEQIFKAMKIPFVTLAGRGYYNRQEVWDVLNLLKALHNPADNLSLAVALRSPMFGFSDEMLLALRLLLNDDGKPIPLWDALQAEDIAHLSSSQMMQVRTAQTILRELRALAGRVKISELLRTALARTGYLASLTGLQGGARLRRNVEKLVDIAEQSGKITLGAFSHYLNDLTDREVREGEAMLDTSGAVRLMTVHASKGLEFPVVVLADAGWERRGGGSAPLIYDSMQETLACKVYDDDEGKLVDSFAYRQATYLQQLRDDAERKRLLYVAATRARDCLILSGEMTVDSKNNWRAKGWLGTVTQAIGLESLEGIQHKHSIPYTDHTNIHVLLPDYDAEIIKTLLGSESATQWRKLDIQTEGDKPKLMHDVTVEPEKLLGHIAATQLANIGGYHYTDNADAQQFYRTSVRRDILDESAPRIRDAIRTRDPRVRPRQLGEVVHEALRYWRFPDEHDNIDDILRSYAWQQNITDEAQIADVVRRA